MLTPVMQYAELGYDVSLLTDELHCQWFVMVRRGTEAKFLACVGCVHGLDLFDMCVQKVRNNQWLS